MIRLASPDIRAEDLEAVRRVLESGWLVQGKHVAAFEDAIADFLGVEAAVAVNSGTSALHTALSGLGVHAGDKVAVSAYSHVASANVVELVGAEPVFVDVEPRTFNMDPRQLGLVLDERSQQTGDAEPLAAIVLVHAFGQMANLDAIRELADRYEIPVVEDAACGLGAKWSGQGPGSTTPAACFSFHPRKAITTGEGGMLVTNDGRLADAARAFRNHGQEPGSTPPDFVSPGLNYRMTEFQAVLGSSALSRLEEGIALRQQAANRYDNLLAGLVDVPAVPEESEHVYQSYVVLLSDNVAPARSRLIDWLRDNGVESQIGTYSIPMTSYYQQRYGYTEASFPVSSDLFARSLALPMHEKLTADDQEQVAEALRRGIEACGSLQ